MAQGYVCKKENADVIYNYNAPFTCAELVDEFPVWTNANNWCQSHAGQDSDSPPCTVVGCCEHILGSDDELNPLQGILYFDLNNNEISEEAYICCTGGTYETFGCLDPQAINYDPNATFDPGATAENQFGGCIYSTGASEINITSDDGYYSYYENYKVEIVKWADNPSLQNLVFSVEEDEDLILDLDDGILSPTADLPICNWEQWWDCKEVYILMGPNDTPESGYIQELNYWDAEAYPYYAGDLDDGGLIKLCENGTAPPCKGRLFVDLKATNEPYTSSDIGIEPDTVKYKPNSNIYGTDRIYFYVKDVSTGYFSVAKVTINIIGKDDIFSVFEENIPIVRIPGMTSRGFVNFDMMSGIDDAEKWGIVYDPDFLFDENCLAGITGDYSRDESEWTCNNTGFCADNYTECLYNGEDILSGEPNIYCSTLTSNCWCLDENGDEVDLEADDCETIECDETCHYTLNKKGLFDYGFKIRFKGEGTNILSPQERIIGTVIQGGQEDLLSLKNGVTEFPNKEYTVVGYRDEENRCCSQYVNDIYQPNCQIAMQTRFTINEMWKGTTNYFPLSIQKMLGTTNEAIFSHVVRHSGGADVGSYLYTKEIDKSELHPHILKIEWGGDCSLWSDEDPTTCSPSDTGYLDFGSKGNNLTTMNGDVLFVSFDYKQEVNSPRWNVIPYQDGYKNEEYDEIQNPCPNQSGGYCTEVVEFNICDENGNNPGTGNSACIDKFLPGGWRRAVAKIIVTSSGGEIFIRFDLRGSDNTSESLNLSGGSTNRAIPYSIYLDNFQLTRDITTPYVEDYSFSSLLDPIYQEYLLDVNVQNSPHQFCSGDKILRFSELGATGGFFDIQFIEQQGHAKLDVRVNRLINGVPGGQPHWDGNERTAQHHLHGFQEGIKLTVQPGPADHGGGANWNHCPIDTNEEAGIIYTEDDCEDLKYSAQLFNWYLDLANNSENMFQGHYAAPGRGSVFMMGCESGFTIVAPKFHARDGNDFYFSGFVTDAFGHGRIITGQNRNGYYWNETFYGTQVTSFGDSIDDQTHHTCPDPNSPPGEYDDLGIDGSHSGKPCGTPEGENFGFKKGEQIGIFTYTGVATGDYSYSANDAIEWVYSAGNEPGDLIPDYSLYSFDKKAWPWEFALPGEFQTGFDSYPGDQNFVGNSLFERPWGIVEDGTSHKYIPYGVSCGGVKFETPWRIQSNQVYDYGGMENRPGLAPYNIPVIVEDGGFFHGSLNHNLNNDFLDIENSKLEYISNAVTETTGLESNVTYGFGYMEFFTANEDELIEYFLKGINASPDNPIRCTNESCTETEMATYTVPQVYRDVEYDFEEMVLSDWYARGSVQFELDQLYYLNNNDEEKYVEGTVYPEGGLPFFIDDLQAPNTNVQLYLYEPLNNLINDSESGAQTTFHSTLSTEAVDYQKNNTVNGLNAFVATVNNTGNYFGIGYTFEIVPDYEVYGEAKDDNGNFKLAPGQGYMFSTNILLPEDTADVFKKYNFDYLGNILEDVDWKTIDLTYNQCETPNYHNCLADAISLSPPEDNESTDIPLISPVSDGSGIEWPVGVWSKVAGQLQTQPLVDTYEGKKYINIMITFPGIGTCFDYHNFINKDVKNWDIETIGGATTIVTTVDDVSENEKDIYLDSTSADSNYTELSYNATSLSMGPNLEEEFDINQIYGKISTKIYSDKLSAARRLNGTYYENINWDVFPGTIILSLYVRGEYQNTYNEWPADKFFKVSIQHGENKREAEIQPSAEWERVEVIVNDWQTFKDSSTSDNFITVNMSGIQDLMKLSVDRLQIEAHHHNYEIDAASQWTEDYVKDLDCMIPIGEGYGPKPSCMFYNDEEYCNGIEPLYNLSDVMKIYTYGGQLELGNGLNNYQVGDQISLNTVTVPIQITGINVPKIHALRYNDLINLDNDLLWGIQDGQLAFANGLTYEEWVTIVQTQSIDPYLDPEGDWPSSQGTLTLTNLFDDHYVNLEHNETFINQDPNFGDHAVGSIDFSTWIYKTDFPEVLISIIKESGEVIPISDYITHQDTQLWNEVANAINKGFEENPIYSATVEESTGEGNSNLKTVVVRALEVGEQYNGKLAWNVPASSVDTINSGDEQIAAMPTFNDIVKGNAYPVLHLYEDFGEIELEISGSDVDGGDLLTFDAFPANRLLVSASIENYNLYHFDAENNRVEGAHPWGESLMVGGTSNTPDWIDDGIIEVGEGDDSELVPMGETRASATIKLVAQHGNCFLNEATGEYESTNDIPCYTDSDGDVLIPNYVGDVDVTIQVKDSAYIKDRQSVRLKIHPINDPPLISFYSDAEVFVNNPNYPTDINLELKAWDIEEGDNIQYKNVRIVDSNYMIELMGMTDELQAQFIADDNIDYNEDGEISVLECSEYGRTIGDTTGLFSEYSCSMMDYNQDGVIDDADITAISQEITNPNYVPMASASLTNTPNWMANVDTFEQNIGEFKTYVHAIPHENMIGTGSIIVSATDTGVNEDGQFTEIRTGFRKLKIRVGGITMAGPDGNLLSIEEASLGAFPDTYNYTAKGDDDREKIPTKIEKDFEIELFRYHNLANGEDDYILSECGNLPYYGNPGQINQFGECCSSVPEPLTLKQYYNLDKDKWYRQEFLDEVDLFVSYFKTDVPKGDWCHARINYEKVVFKGVEPIESDNVGGFLAPNVGKNPLDYVSWYSLEIRDIVDDYASVPGANGTEETLYLIDGAPWWTNYFDSEQEYRDEWLMLKEEWNLQMTGSNSLEDTGDPDYELPEYENGTQNPNYETLLFRAGPFTQENDNLEKIIIEGFNYKYNYPSFYNVAISASDSYGFVSVDNTIIDATSLVKLKQTLLNKYSPWQGMNLTGSAEVKNSYLHIDGRDKDMRPSLGLFYYDEINNWRDWHTKYGTLYQSAEDPDLNPGGWTTSYPGEYYPGESINQIQNSQLFDNLSVSINPSSTISGNHSQLLTECVDLFTSTFLSESTIQLGQNLCLELIEGRTEITPDVREELIDELRENVSFNRKLYDEHIAGYSSAWAFIWFVLWGFELPGEYGQFVNPNNSNRKYNKWFLGGRGWDNEVTYADGVYVQHYISPYKKGIQITATDKKDPMDEPLAYEIVSKRSLTGYENYYMCDYDYFPPTNTDDVYIEHPFTWQYTPLYKTYPVEPSCQDNCRAKISFDCNFNGTEQICTDWDFAWWWWFGGPVWWLGATISDLWWYCDEWATLEKWDCEKYANNDNDGNRIVYRSEGECVADCYTIEGECSNPGGTAKQQRDETYCSSIGGTWYTANSAQSSPAFDHCDTVQSIGHMKNPDGTRLDFQYNLAQSKKTPGASDTDRIFSIFVKREAQATDSLATICLEHTGYDSSEESDSNFQSKMCGTMEFEADGTLSNTTANGDWVPRRETHTTHQIYNMEIYPFDSPYGYETSPENWQECDNDSWCVGGHHLLYNDFTHQFPGYYRLEKDELGERYANPDVPMFYYEDVGDGWYKISVRTQGEDINNYFTARIYPNGLINTNAVIDWDSNLNNIIQSQGEYPLLIWGAQVQEIEYYKTTVYPYQRTRDVGEVGVYEFLPDVDVRSPMSLDSSGKKSVMYKYYDEQLQPGEYFETAAPVEAQLYFYIRDAFEEELFQPKAVLDYIPNTLYIGFLDWGDGSPIEYDTEPFKLGYSSVLRHTYTKSGIYEIRGEMFNTAMSSAGYSLGIGNFKEFLIRINISSDFEIEQDFKQLGGGKPTYYPYSTHTDTPVVGGVSDYSAYVKTIKRYSGYMAAGDRKMDIDFLYYKDQFDTETALARSDENFVGPMLTAFTGSYASESYHGLADEEEVYSYNDLTTLTTAEDSWRGFYSGSWNEGDGSIYGRSELINRGSGTNFGVLGDFLGDTDVGQVRYFKQPTRIWEMLGFAELNSGNPGNVRYWNNIVPRTYDVVTERTGIYTEDEIPDELQEDWCSQNEYGCIDVMNPQIYTGTNAFGNFYYYPVLPKLDRFGKFNEEIGLQGHEGANLFYDEINYLDEFEYSSFDDPFPKLIPSPDNVWRDAQEYYEELIEYGTFAGDQLIIAKIWEDINPNMSLDDWVHSDKFTYWPNGRVASIDLSKDEELGIVFNSETTRTLPADFGELNAVYKLNLENQEIVELPNSIGLMFQKSIFELVAENGGFDSYHNVITATAACSQEGGILGSLTDGMCVFDNTKWEYCSDLYDQEMDYMWPHPTFGWRAFHGSNGIDRATFHSSCFTTKPSMTNNIDGYCTNTDDPTGTVIDEISCCEDYASTEYGILGEYDWHCTDGWSMDEETCEGPYYCWFFPGGGSGWQVWVPYEECVEDIFMAPAGNAQWVNSCQYHTLGTYNPEPIYQWISAGTTIVPDVQINLNNTIGYLVSKTVDGETRPGGNSGLPNTIGNWSKLNRIEIGDMESRQTLNLSAEDVYIPNVFYGWKSILTTIHHNWSRPTWQLPVGACHIWLNSMWNTSLHAWNLFSNNIPGEYWNYENFFGWDNTDYTEPSGEYDFDLGWTQSLNDFGNPTICDEYRNEWELNALYWSYFIQNETNTYDYHIPYGNKESWNSTDETALVTNSIYNSQYFNDSIIDLNFESADDGALGDDSGKGNLGIFITDYSISYAKNTLEPQANDAVNQVILTDEDKRNPY